MKIEEIVTLLILSETRYIRSVSLLSNKSSDIHTLQNHKGKTVLGAIENNIA